MYSDTQKLVYASWSNNDLIRKNSSSGGIFSEIASRFIDDGGVVFGATQDENLNIVHIPIYTILDLEKIRGSKYVQSNLNNTFVDIHKLLCNKKKVMFVGTPCQVAGLYAFLGDRYEKCLLTIDLVCHGVSSPFIYKQYIIHLEKKYNKKIKRFIFRDKEKSWFTYSIKIVFEDGSSISNYTNKDEFTRGYLREYFLRPSCYACKYTNTNRVGDITLADFWGYVSTCEEDRDNDKGISLVIINSESGKNIFDKTDNITKWKRTLETATSGNLALRSKVTFPHERTDFWDEYEKFGIGYVVNKYMKPEKIPYYSIFRYLEIHYRRCPKVILKLVAKIMYACGISF